MSVGGQLPGTFGESFHVFLRPSPTVPCPVSPHIIGGGGQLAPAVSAARDISDPINIIKLELRSHTLPAAYPPGRPGEARGQPASTRAGRSSAHHPVLDLMPVAQSGRPFAGAHVLKHVRTLVRSSRAQGFWSLGAHDVGRKPTRIVRTASRIASPSDVVPLGPLVSRPAHGPEVAR